MTSTREGLLTAADRYLVGGCLGMFRLPDESATVFARGEGGHIYDVEGRDFIDFVMGSGPMILGHSHPAVVAAVQEQVGMGSTFYGLNEPAIRLAGKVVEASPCGEQIRFTSSGTEATFAALRIARARLLRLAARVARLLAHRELQEVELVAVVQQLLLPLGRV